MERKSRAISFKKKHILFVSFNFNLSSYVIYLMFFLMFLTKVFNHYSV